MGPRPSRTPAPPARRERARRQASWPAAPAPSPAASTRARITHGSPVLSETTARREPSDRDMRRRRPPALSFLLRMDTARRLARVISLLALDFAGVALAILTALLLKAAVRDHVQLSPAPHETERILAFAYLLTVLLFARSGLYAERAQRPGLSRIVSSLFQVTVVALIFALVNGEEYSSYYIFYGTLIFAIGIIGSLRWGYERLTGALLC